ETLYLERLVRRARMPPHEHLVREHTRTDHPRPHGHGSHRPRLHGPSQERRRHDGDTRVSMRFAYPARFPCKGKRAVFFCERTIDTWSPLPPGYARRNSTKSWARSTWWGRASRCGSPSRKSISFHSSSGARPARGRRLSRAFMRAPLMRSFTSFPPYLPEKTTLGKSSATERRRSDSTDRKCCFSTRFIASINRSKIFFCRMWSRATSRSSARQRRIRHSR